jgi:GNAT superfamily N-acetyltransferase
MRIEPYRPDYLTGVQRLVNHHIGAVYPGWALPAAYIEQHLRRNPHQFIIDPWVAERKTLVAVERQNVVAVAHLLRYGKDEVVGKDYQGACDIAWLLAWEENIDEAAALLDAALEQIKAWNATHIYAFDSHVPTSLIMGIPDVWSHLNSLFGKAGFEPSPERNEALYGGWLRDTPTPSAPPIDGMVFKRSIGRVWGVLFTAWIGDEQVGFCEVVADLTEGGAVPCLRDWAELGNLYIEEEWRGRGIGSWLLQHAIGWLRMAGCDRIVLCCTADDEAAGAGRFYRRFGWDVFTRVQDGWELKQSAP